MEGDRKRGRLRAGSFRTCWRTGWNSHKPGNTPAGSPTGSWAPPRAAGARRWAGAPSAGAGAALVRARAGGPTWERAGDDDNVVAVEQHGGREGPALRSTHVCRGRRKDCESTAPSTGGREGD